MKVYDRKLIEAQSREIAKIKGCITGLGFAVLLLGIGLAFVSRALS